ncbi:hypothetical protein C1Y63_10460 [Corynebacterium sp. 13CS0277]|uniref:hypothetical protein n=1 Tax=Corynebacterium sp. 13CS0277 TaxID=2071994 RepID=UPI000D0431C3|nr:hypothetical protein [Corynebacterium sp. 13CS0277]PRQ10608.1 hypothetical protein C1Y63_10460 [Corynebacterium sp. 13CS0277]
MTASKLPTILHDADTYLGLGYKTAFDTWLEMRGHVEEHHSDATLAMFADAHDAEDYAVNVWKRKNPGWTTSKGEVAYRNPALDFPHLVSLDRVARRGRARHIIEVKRPQRQLAAPREAWIMQVIFQMGVSGIHDASIVMVPRYGENSITPVPWDPELFDVMVEQAREFMALVESGDPPEMDTSTYAKTWLAESNPVNESEPPVELDGDLAGELIAAWDVLRDAEARVTALENQVAAQLGDAPAGRFQGSTLVSRRAGTFSARRLSDEQKAPYMTKLALDTKALRAAEPDLYEQARGAATYTFNRKEFLR